MSLASYCYYGFQPLCDFRQRLEAVTTLDTRLRASYGGLRRTTDLPSQIVFGTARHRFYRFSTPDGAGAYAIRPYVAGTTGFPACRLHV